MMEEPEPRVSSLNPTSSLTSRLPASSPEITSSSHSFWLPSPSLSKYLQPTTSPKGDRLDPSIFDLPK